MSPTSYLAAPPRTHSITKSLLSAKFFVSFAKSVPVSKPGFRRTLLVPASRRLKFSANSTPTGKSPRDGAESPRGEAARKAISGGRRRGSEAPPVRGGGRTARTRRGCGENVLGWWGEKGRTGRLGFGPTLAPEHLAGEDGLPRVRGDATRRTLAAGLWCPGGEAATPHQRRSPSVVVRHLPGPDMSRESALSAPWPEANWPRSALRAMQFGSGVLAENRRWARAAAKPEDSPPTATGRPP